MNHRLAQNRPGRRGFTLVEVLCALVLIGIVLPAAMRGVSIAVQAAGRARHVSEATELARHKLSELGLSTDTGSYTGNGDFAPDWPDYRWESRSADRDYGVTELTVEVFWKSQGQDQSVTLTTLVYPGAYASSTDATGDSTGTAAGTGGTTP